MLFFLLMILGVGHWFFYVSLKRFFYFKISKINLVFFWGPYLLTFGFCFSFIALHYFNNLFLRTIYFISGFWLALFFYWILACCLSWVYLFIVKFTGSFGKIKIFCSFLFILSVLYLIYGTWNTFNITVKKIPLSLQGKAPAFVNKRIVQISDLHLGILNRRAFLAKIVAKVNALQPDLVLITGDVFDVDSDTFIIQELDKIRTTEGIFFIFGNHETYLNKNRIKGLLKDSKIRLLDNEVAQKEGLNIIGINYPMDDKDTSAVFTRLTQKLPDFNQKFNIVMTHEPINVDFFSQHGANLQLAGHTHKGQLFPVGFLTSLIFKGYDYGLYRLDEDSSLYTTCGLGSWGPLVRTQKHPEIVVFELQ